jgi:hypothetical protein
MWERVHQKSDNRAFRRFQLITSCHVAMRPACLRLVFLVSLSTTFHLISASCDETETYDLGYQDCQSSGFYNCNNCCYVPDLVQCTPECTCENPCILPGEVPCYISDINIICCPHGATCLGGRCILSSCGGSSYRDCPCQICCPEGAYCDCLRNTCTNCKTNDAIACACIRNDNTLFSCCPAGMTCDCRDSMCSVAIAVLNDAQVCPDGHSLCEKCSKCCPSSMTCDCDSERCTQPFSPNT